LLSTAYHTFICYSATPHPSYKSKQSNRTLTSEDDFFSSSLTEPVLLLPTVHIKSQKLTCWSFCSSLQ